MSTVLPRTLLLPPLPRTGDQELDRYLAALGDALSNNHQMVSERVEDLTDYGLAATRPAASGAGRFFWETDTSLLKFDDGAWDTVYNSAHTHDDRYFTETESDLRFAAISHAHVEADITDLDHTDAYAIHDNVAAEISALTAVTAAATDVVLIEDASDSWNKKKVALSDLIGDADAFHKSVADEFDSLDYAVPVSTDKFIFEDASDSSNKKYATLSTLSDTHDHDADYYTESEVNNLIDDYLPLTAGSTPKLTGDLYFGTNNLAIVGKATTGSYYDILSMNASNQAKVGDGNINVFLDAKDSIFMGDYGVGVRMYDTVSTHKAILEMTTGPVLLIGDPAVGMRLDAGDFTLNASSIYFRAPGYSGTASPTTTQWTNDGDWGIHVETDANKVYLAYNYGGTIKKVELT
jgi:hypothetical protein